MKLTIYTDGGARGNPGPAASAFVIFEGKNLVKEYKKCLGIGTNNQAEYTALIKALEFARDLGGTDLVVFSDSQLMVRQLLGEYKVKNATLHVLYEEVKKLEEAFETIVYQHVRRENPGIVMADALVNQALDGV